MNTATDHYTGNSFTNKSEVPCEESVKAKLNSCYVHWIALKEFIQKEQGELTVEWKHYGQKTGWLAKHVVKKRNIFFLIPMENGFRISMTFGEKAVCHIQESDLPEDVLSAVSNAKKYAEGRTVQIPVSTEYDIQIIKSLIEIKLMN